MFAFLDMRDFMSVACFFGTAGNESSAGGGTDNFEFISSLAGAIAHDVQSHSAADALGLSPGAGESQSVIQNLEGGSAGISLQGNQNLRGLSVPGRIVDRLLSDAIEMARLFFGKILSVAPHLER